MKNLYLLLVLIGMTAFSCSSIVPEILSRKTQHEKYADRLDKKDLDKTPQGQAWLQAAKTSVQFPEKINLPYQHAGIFHADKPRAIGLGFGAKRGELVSVKISKAGSDQFVLYADLFREGEVDPTPVFSIDTNDSVFSFAVEESGNYILRIQPEIERVGKYDLTILSGPSLGFPVQGKANIGSFWGAERDGGKRKHEGIDIFAPKRTPVVAAADGYVSGVREGGIGGKVVWLKVKDKNLSLYYAHLDEQLVKEGQFVRKGEILGLVGNTGNARTTSPHLHFGIYSFQGAEDPILYVKQQSSKPSKIPEKNITHYKRLTKNQKLENGTVIPDGSRLVPLAVTATGLLSESETGTVFLAPFSRIKETKEPVGQFNAIAQSDKNKF